MNPIQDWIGLANDEKETEFRQAIHLILLAIARDKNLSHTLAIKGGIVLSIVYSSERFTTDLDLSCLEDIKNLSKEKLEISLSRQLVAVTAINNYNLKLLIHSIKQNPKNFKNSKFPAYKVKIGYANSSKPKEIRRLEAKQAVHVIELDISFNEGVLVTDTINFKLNEKQNVLCYSTEQLMAEKYRSVLQQVVRNRTRRQDIYDIYHLLEYNSDFLYKKETQKVVLDKLLKSSTGKGIEDYLHSNGMMDEEIKKRSLEDFNTLELEINITQSPEIMYEVVEDYFRSLPWI